MFNPHEVAWVDTLTYEQLQIELETRGLRSSGPVSRLRARLLHVLQLRRDRGRPERVLSPLTMSHPLVNWDVSAPQPGPSNPEGLEPRGGIPDVSMNPVPNVEEEENRLPRNRTVGGGPSPSAIYDVMRKWNLKFAGTSGEDAEAFLIRIEEGRALIPVTDRDILRCLPFFLSGIALHWFRNGKSRWDTWTDFVTALRGRFGDPDFQFALRDEILRRTQGETEPLADYLTCIRALFDRLNPKWTEEEQLNYAHRNMLPRFQIAIMREDLTNFDAFEQLARRVEKSFRAVQGYRPPPNPERSLFPDLAYRGSRTTARSQHTAMAAAAFEHDHVTEVPRNTPSSNRSRSRNPERTDYDRRENRRFDRRTNRQDSNVSPVNSRVPPTLPSSTTTTRQRLPNPNYRSNAVTVTSTAANLPTNPFLPANRIPEGPTDNNNLVTATVNEPPTRAYAIICWNCRQVGHRFSACTQNRRIFCFRCGRDAVTSRECPVCSGNA